MIVRPFPGDGVRVTIGTPEENDAFLRRRQPALQRSADQAGRAGVGAGAQAPANSTGWSIA